MNQPRNISDILERLTNVKSSGKEKWTSDCPCSGHATPAGHLSIADIGTKALVTCFNSHSYADICRALGFETLTYGLSEKSYHLQLVDTYDYYNIDGSLLYQVEKYLTGNPAKPKTFKVKRPDGNYGLGDVKPVLYNLPDIYVARLYDEVVYVCEGEKDADTAFIYFGTPGTTNPFGAGKWNSQYSEMLRGCRVTVIPDNDVPGQTHCAQVCTSLFRKAKSLTVWRVPAPFKDLTEWVEATNG